MREEIFKKVDKYISDLLAPEDDILKETIQSLDREGIPQISISATQGKFLQVMAALCNASRILELGTLGGYSTIWFARGLPTGGKIITVDLEQKHIDVAKNNIIRAGLADKVEFRVGKATDVLEQMIRKNEAPFDLIFIDADKPPYATYFELSLKLSRPGTLLICDNVIRDGKVLDTGSTDEIVQGVQRFNSVLSKSSKVTAIILPIVGVKEYDGMALAVVR